MERHMKTLDIIEQNLTKDEFISFLRGTIIKFALQGQSYGDAMNIKRHAEKLVEVLSDNDATDAVINASELVEKLPTVPPQIKSFDYTEKEPTVDPDEPKVQPKYKFKLGDRVIIKCNVMTGTIIRLPTAGFEYPSAYVVQLDDKTIGWIGSLERDGVDCKNGWFASEENLELINEVSLETNKWYHTIDFTAEELQALLPQGTMVEVETKALYYNINTTPPTDTKQATVEKVTSSALGKQTYIEIANSYYYKEWFKIVQED